MRFSIVVPLVPDHDGFFFEFLSELSRNPERVGEVIVSRSSGKSQDIFDFENHLATLIQEKKITFRIEILHTNEILLAGENRNRGWKRASCEYVLFCDADDTYSPFRLQMLEEAILILDPDLLVHDYYSGEQLEEYAYRSPEMLDYVLTSEIHESTFLNNPRDRSSEGKSPGDTNIRVPFKLNNHVKIHHAHTCVRNDLRSKFLFGDTYRAEDGQFCRDILESNFVVCYIPWELSTWVYSRSTASTSNLHPARKVLNRIKKSFTSRN